MRREGKGEGMVKWEGKSVVNEERFKVKKEIRKAKGKWLR